ncbi:MAG: MMPL family transporter, partial [Candidatus Kariarchaeaceae archaeon]
FTRAETDVNHQKNNKKYDTIWVKWSRLVMNHPIKFIVLAFLILTPFIILSAQADLSFDTVKNLPAGTESREGFEILFDEFNLGEINPYKVVIDAKTTNGIFNEEIIDATNKLGDWALSYNETRSKDGSIFSFKTASSLSYSTNISVKQGIKMDLTDINQILASSDYIVIPNGTNDPIIMPNYEKIIFVNTVFNDFVNKQYGNDTLLIDLTSNLDPGTAAAWDLVRILRNKVKEIFGDISGIDTYVTGFAASFADTSSSMYSDVPLMVTLAVILIFLALMVLFRSLLLPAKAILTIGGSILFSLGVLVYVFQHGNFLWLINGEQIGVTFIIPVFLFTIVLGLGMDYSIFIISRIKEEVENGTSSDDAVGIGLAKTAGVVTSAATVMIATFMVFALAPISFLKSIGLAMAAAIFIDATIARTILLPAAMKLAGKWNWYLPEWLKKILPEVKLDH